MFLALALSLFSYGLSPSNMRPNNCFGARSEEGEKSCVCLFLYTSYAPFKPLIKAKKEEKAIRCDLSSTDWLLRASELGQRKEKNHVLYAVYATFKALLKAQHEDVIYYLPIVFSCIPLITSVWSLPFKHAPYQGFQS